MPDNSYIDIFNFSSPKDLATFLKEVGNNEIRYNSYFHWKNYYCIEETNFTFLCDLCKKLKFSTEINSKRDKRNLINWWFQEANCQS